MAVQSVYSPVGAVSERPAPIAFFIMDKLLYSRMESGYPSNEEFFDEDVNVYIASLLGSLADNGGSETLLQPGMHYDQPLFEEAAMALPREALRLYRTGADNLLISLGIFGNPTGRRPHSAAGYALSDKAYAGRGALYYRLAESFAVKVARRRSGLSDVLGKLSRGFDSYVKVLSLLKSEYFNMLHRLSDGELYHLGRSPDSDPGTGVPGYLYDEFLDAYSSFMRERSPDTRERLKAKAAEITSLDPSFRFDIP